MRKAVRTGLSAECEMLSTIAVICIDDRREEEGGGEWWEAGILITLATGSKSVIRQCLGRQPPLRPPTSRSLVLVTELACKGGLQGPSPEPLEGHVDVQGG